MTIDHKFAFGPYSIFFNLASKLRCALLFPLLLTSQVFSSGAPVPLECIVSNLSSHITIPVAITAVQKDGTLKTKIANDGQSDVSAKLDQQTQSCSTRHSMLQARDLPSRTFQDC